MKKYIKNNIKTLKQGQRNQSVVSQSTVNIIFHEICSRLDWQNQIDSDSIKK